MAPTASAKSEAAMGKARAQKRAVERPRSSACCGSDTTLSSPATAWARKVSSGTLGSPAAAGRCRATRATPRYSRTWTGDAFSQARNSAASFSPNEPVWFAMNHSAACWAIADRICSSLGVTRSLPLRHVASAVRQPLGEIFLHHIGGHPQSLGDLLVSQPVAVLENERGSPPGRKSLEHRAQTLDHLRALELAVQGSSPSRSATLVSSSSGLVVSRSCRTA